MKLMKDPKYVSAVMATLKKLGYDCTYTDNEIAVSKNGERILEILTDTEYRVRRNAINDTDYDKIRNCCQSVQEAYAIYKAAPQMEYDTLSHYRKLNDFNGYILAARICADGSFEFATWQKSAINAEVGLGHYFEGYEHAKEDFALRCGLVDRYKMFDEIELKLIRQGLVHLGADYPHLTVEQMTTVGKVIEQIEAIVPEIQEHEEMEHSELVPDDELEL